MDLPAITDLLVRANATPYDIRTVAEEKVAGAGYAGEPVVRVHGDYAGVSVTCGKHLRLLAVDPAQRGRGIGTALLRDAESRGASIVAAEPGNYFTPGIIDSDVATLEFFRKRGYKETARTQNLIAPVEDSRPRQSSARRDDVLRFIEAKFGPIWRFEAAKAATIFHTEAKGAITGFATHEANNRGLGFFGPTGVDPAFRGRGLGRDLLRASLSDLKRLGYREAVIPWTDAIEFYRKSCGAEIAHRFVIMRRIAR